MSKIRIYIIASVSSLFIGVSVGLMVTESDISAWAVWLGIFAAAGGMMIELTVPEMLITVWNLAGWVYRILAIAATVASPFLLIMAMPDHGIARFSVAFIVASLITYVSFYVMQRLKENETTEKRESIVTVSAQAAINEAKAKAENEERFLRLQTELEIEKQKQLAAIETERQARLEKVRATEERKTRKALAKINGLDVLPYSREAVIELIQAEPGLSQRELGRRFGRSPQKVMGEISDLIETGIVTANGHGVIYTNG